MSNFHEKWPQKKEGKVIQAETARAVLGFELGEGGYIRMTSTDAQR